MIDQSELRFRLLDHAHFQGLAITWKFDEIPKQSLIYQKDLKILMIDQSQLRFSLLGHAHFPGFAILLIIKLL